MSTAVTTVNPIESVTYKLLPNITDILQQKIEKLSKMGVKYRSVEHRISIDIENIHDIAFRHLKVVQHYLGGKYDEIRYSMKIGMFLCCFRALDCSCSCDVEDEDVDECDCDCHNSCDHEAVYASNKNFDVCYATLMKRIHYIFKCSKCKEIVRDKFQHKKVELVCTSCLLHQDMYAHQPEIVRKRKLFDCYICCEENMNKKFKAELKCDGQSLHTDELCKWCFMTNNRKCPQCKQ